MESSIILIPIIIISAFLILRMIKSSEFGQATPETRKAFIRLFVGGIVGAFLLLSIFWLYLIAVGRTPNKLNPYIATLPYIASLPVSLVGFWVGSMVGLMKKNKIINKEKK